MAHSDKKGGFFVRNLRFFVLMLVYVTLFLVVSTFMLVKLTQPAGKVSVPDVTGKKFTQVYNSLIQKELKPVLTFKDAGDIDAGLVLRQHPVAGAIVSRESRIKLVVSRNAQKVELPPLVGDELVIAKNKLKTLNIGERKISLETGVISYVPSESHAENVVIAQSPKAGESVTPDSRVNLLVSMGSVKPEMKMPDVVTQHIDLSFDLLLSYGVNIEQEVVDTDDINQSGVILEQNPAAGSTLSKGDTVKLKVAFFERDMNYYAAYEKVSVIVKKSKEEKPSLYEAWIDDDSQKRVRFSKMCMPGEEISFVFYRKGNARVELVKDKKKEKVIRINSGI